MKGLFVNFLRGLPPPPSDVLVQMFNDDFYIGVLLFTFYMLPPIPHAPRNRQEYQ